MPYQTELDAMIKAANASTRANYFPFIIVVMDVTRKIQLRPIWAKTAFDAIKQCIAQNPTDWIQTVNTVPTGYPI